MNTAWSSSPLLEAEALESFTEPFLHSSGLQQLSVRRGGGGGRLLLRRPHARPLGAARARHGGRLRDGARGREACGGVGRAGASQGEGAGRGGQGSRHRGRAEGARRQPGGAGARRRVLQGGGQEGYPRRALEAGGWLLLLSERAGPWSGRPHRARDGDRRLPARRRPVEPGERLPDGQI